MSDFELMSSPREWNDILDNADRATLLCLHFIGGVKKPFNIPEPLYNKCLEAFENNRGHFESEHFAIYKILEDSSKL